MKKHFRAILCLALLIFTLLSLGTSVFATTTASGNLSRGGVAYELSEDKSYYMVAGYSEHMSSVTVLDDIGGVPVTEIKESAFQNNEYLNKIVIPATVKKIGKAAFRNCKNLSEVVLPDNLTYIPVECFYDCNVLTKITLPSSLTHIDDDAFGNCKLLGKLKIPPSVTEIGHDTFLNCEQLLLDVSENEYAAEYARQENINTDFKNSTAYFLILVGICVAVALIFILLISIPLKKHIKKHPSHDPVVILEKGFGAVGRFFSFIGGLITSGVIFITGKIVAFFELLGKKINQNRAKRLERDNSSSEENGNEFED